jgi:hypothetical protein
VFPKKKTKTTKENKYKTPQKIHKVKKAFKATY